jgi:hypothetical protein
VPTDVLSLLRPVAAALTLALAPAPAAPGEGLPAARTDGEGPPAAEPAGRTPPDAKEEPEKAKDEQETLIDVGHSFVEQRIFAPILRLDRFFSDERDFEAERSQSFLRWRSEVRVTEDDTRPAFTTGVRATLRLPGLNKHLRKLRVVIAGETRDAVRTLFPRGPQTPQDLEGDDEDIGTGDAGLRFYILDTVLSHADLGAGILARLPPGAYGRLRFRTAIPVKRLFLTRTVLTGFWRTDVHFGTSAGLELERLIRTHLVARLAGSGTLTQESRGVEWISELALIAYLGQRLGAVAAVAVNGVTRPAVAARDPLGAPIRYSPSLDRFRVYTRLRRDLYRRWFFVELEPELAWPWTLERGRHPAWGLTLRVEVQFQGEEAPPPPPPPPPPEPKDPEPADALPNEPAPR